MNNLPVDEHARRRFEACWLQGRPEPIERFLPADDQPGYLPTLEELVLIEWEFVWKRRTNDESEPQLPEYLRRFPALNQPEIAARLEEQRQLLRAQYSRPTEGANRSTSHFPGVEHATARQRPVPLADDAANRTKSDVIRAGAVGRADERPGRSSATNVVDTPPRCGRYRIVKTLGAGAFGTVYQAIDDELNRAVAVKVPLARAKSADLYRAEAQSLAGLKHPGIVSVYDVGTTDDGRYFIVSELVAGTDLEKQLKERRFAPEEVAALVADVAVALHHAHTKGLIHRDVKPSNILLDAAGRPRVADFGLALHEDEQRARQGELSGTIPYMSPEQIRAETHQLDGRSDIWSVGVILYEMLTGRRPFQGAGLQDYTGEILHREPKPPRMIDDAIPAELARITLKCLAKPVTERYGTGLELADDLRRWNRPNQTPTRRRWAVAAAVLAVAVLGYWSVRATFAPVPAPNARLIEDFRVIHFLERGDRSEWAGEIGDGSSVTHEKDGVRIRAQFSRPAYCYLIAFNADGREQLCYPTNEATAPQVLPALEYPLDSTEAFYLTDGSGQQAFALVASQTPLPAYRGWRESLGSLSWQHLEPSGAPWFNKHDVVIRGTVGKLKGVEVFEQLCRELRKKSAAEAVEAVAFPVLPPSR